MHESIWYPWHWNVKLTELTNHGFRNAGTCLHNNRLPLSGDVLQWMSTLCLMLKQFGFINSRCSDGSQWGRVLDILEPLVESQADELIANNHGAALFAFRPMAQDVQRCKDLFV